MKHVFLLACMALGAHALGQTQCGGGAYLNACTTVILANTIVFDSTGAFSGGYYCFWVCPGDTLILDGVEHSVWVESGGTVIVGSGNPAGIFASEIGLKDGANLIVPVDTAGLGQGPFNTLWHAPTANIVDPYGWFDQIPCIAVVFDYAQAPSPGCDTTVVAGVSALDAADLNIYPNPAQGTVIVDLPPGEWQAHLIGTAGVPVIQRTGTGRMEIPLQEVKAGVYTLMLMQDEVRHIQKVVVE